MSTTGGSFFFRFFLRFLPSSSFDLSGSCASVDSPAPGFPGRPGLAVPVPPGELGEPDGADEPGVGVGVSDGVSDGVGLGLVVGDGDELELEDGFANTGIDGAATSAAAMVKAEVKVNTERFRPVGFPLP